MLREGPMSCPGIKSAFAKGCRRARSLQGPCGQKPRRVVHDTRSYRRWQTEGIARCQCRAQKSKHFASPSRCPPAIARYVTSAPSPLAPGLIRNSAVSRLGPQSVSKLWTRGRAGRCCKGLGFGIVHKAAVFPLSKSHKSATHTHTQTFSTSG